MKSIKVKKLSEHAILPTRAYKHDAGLDLYANASVYLHPLDTNIIPTGIAVDIPPGYVGLIRDRSSVASKGLKVSAGVIDAGFIGEIGIVMLNLSGREALVEAGQKIAQLLVIPIATPGVMEVNEFETTERGANGFGSTGDGS